MRSERANGVSVGLRLLLLAIVVSNFGDFALAEELPPQPRFLTIHVVLVPGDETLPGVEVLVRKAGDSTAVVASGVTGAKGETRIGPLAPGKYEVTPKLTALQAEYSALVAIVDAPVQIMLLMSIAPQSTCGPGMVTPVLEPVSLMPLPVGQHFFLQLRSR